MSVTENMSATNTKPNFSRPQAAAILKRLYGLSPGEMWPLPSYFDQNFHVAPEEGGEYILKIFNFEDSRRFRRIEVQMQAVSFLQQNGMPVSMTISTVSGQITSLEEAGSHRDMTKAVTYRSYFMVIGKSETCSRMMGLNLLFILIPDVVSFCKKTTQVGE